MTWKNGFVTQSVGARDAYQQATALSEAGWLRALVADFWLPSDWPAVRTAQMMIPSRMWQKLARYGCEQIPSSRIHLCKESLVIAVKLRLLRHLAPDVRLKHYFRQGKAIGTLTARLALSLEAGALAFSYYGKSSLRPLEDTSLPKILFQVHPHAITLRRTYSERLALDPGLATDLTDETEMSDAPGVLEELSDGAFAADLVIAASSYTRATLVDAGVDPCKIAVVPYGVDTVHLPLGPGGRGQNSNFLFVGQRGARKGLPYLLEAWRRADLRDARLTIVSSGIPGESPSREALRNTTWLGRVSQSELVRLYGESDVVVLPSIAEGFGLVLLEALACGATLIATTNTGAPDVGRTGDIGLLIEPADVEQLADALVTCHSSRNALRQARLRRRAAVSTFTWERFRSGIREAINSIEGDSFPDSHQVRDRRSL